MLYESVCWTFNREEQGWDQAQKVHMERSFLKSFNIKEALSAESGVMLLLPPQKLWDLKARKCFLFFIPLVKELLGYFWPGEQQEGRSRAGEDAEELKLGTRCFALLEEGEKYVGPFATNHITSLFYFHGCTLWRETGRRKGSYSESSLRGLFVSLYFNWH